jgi:hypothetical protein
MIEDQKFVLHTIKDGFHWGWIYNKVNGVWHRREYTTFEKISRFIPWLRIE